MMPHRAWQVMGIDPLGRRAEADELRGELGTGWVHRAQRALGSRSRASVNRAEGQVLEVGVHQRVGRACSRSSWSRAPPGGRGPGTCKASGSWGASQALPAPGPSSASRTGEEGRVQASPQHGN